jgi:hypothetical protein
MSDRTATGPGSGTDNIHNEWLDVKDPRALLLGDQREPTAGIKTWIKLTLAISDLDLIVFRGYQYRTRRSGRRGLFWKG